MSDDLVARLRYWVANTTNAGQMLEDECQLMTEAADELERLTKPLSEATTGEPVAVITQFSLVGYRLPR